MGTSAAGVPNVPCKLILANQEFGLDEAWLDAWGWGGGSITAEQLTTASNTIGIGESYNSGPWGQSGSVAVTVTSSQDNSQPGIVNAYVYNRINNNEYRTQACPIPDDYWQPVGFYATVTPIITAPHHTFTQVCIYRPAGWFATISGTTNITFAFGVNFGPVSVSSQSGYTTAGTEKFTTSRNTWECGNSTAGLEHSSQFEVHSG